MVSPRVFLLRELLLLWVSEAWGGPKRVKTRLGGLNTAKVYPLIPLCPVTSRKRHEKRCLVCGLRYKGQTSRRSKAGSVLNETFERTDGVFGEMRFPATSQDSLLIFIDDSTPSSPPSSYAVVLISTSFCGGNNSWGDVTS